MSGDVRSGTPTDPRDAIVRVLETLGITPNLDWQVQNREQLADEILAAVDVGDTQYEQVGWLGPNDKFWLLGPKDSAWPENRPVFVRVVSSTPNKGTR